jgi:hypothetical protein
MHLERSGIDLDPNTSLVNQMDDIEEGSPMAMEVDAR